MLSSSTLYNNLIPPPPLFPFKRTTFGSIGGLDKFKKTLPCFEYGVSRIPPPAIRDVICNERIVESLKRFPVRVFGPANFCLLACLQHMHTDGGRTARTDKWSGGGCCMAFIWSRKFPIKAYHGIGSGSGSGPRSAGILGRGGAEGIDSYTMFSYLCVTNEGGGRRWWLVGWLVGSRTTRRFFPQSFQMFDDDKKK